MWERQLRLRLAITPIGIGVALVATGTWVYSFPGATCTSAGFFPPSAPCPVPSSYYELPIALLLMGAVSFVLGVLILVAIRSRSPKTEVSPPRRTDGSSSRSDK